MEVFDGEGGEGFEAFWEREVEFVRWLDCWIVKLFKFRDIKVLPRACINTKTIKPSNHLAISNTK